MDHHAFRPQVELMERKAVPSGMQEVAGMSPAQVVEHNTAVIRQKLPEEFPDMNIDPTFYETPAVPGDVRIPEQSSGTAQESVSPALRTAEIATDVVIGTVVVIIGAAVFKKEIADLLDGAKALTHPKGPRITTSGRGSERRPEMVPR